MVGVPADEVDVVVAWTHDMALGSVAGMRRDIDPEARHLHERALHAGVALAEYVRSLLDHPVPPDSLMARLLAASHSGMLRRSEVLASCVLLLLAATETTARLIGNTIALLADHPAQRKRVIADAALAAPAVEEVLRFSGPAQFDPRLVTAAARVGEARLVAGDVVWLLTAAAGRDPARFKDPSRFDIGRSPNPHLAFGHGLHHCLGAPLARLEARAVLTRLLADVPDHEVVHVDYGDGFFVRGPERLDLVSARRVRTRNLGSAV